MDYSATEKQDNTLAVVLLAAAVGAVAGLLMAPKKGTEMREEMRDKYMGIKNSTQNGVENAKAKADNTLTAAKDKIHTVADKTKDATDIKSDAAEDSLEAVSNRAKAAMEDAKPRAKRGGGSIDEI